MIGTFDVRLVKHLKCSIDLVLHKVTYSTPWVRAVVVDFVQVAPLAGSLPFRFALNVVKRRIPDHWLAVFVVIVFLELRKGEKKAASVTND